jgi:hypothetical protein
MGGFEGSTHLELKAWVVHRMLSFPWHVFVLNDGNKLNPIWLQTIHVICHFVCQNYNANSTTKRRKGMISYNQQHGTISMKRYILGEHLATWRKWKSVNGGFDSKDLHQEKSKKKSIIGYGAITNHFGNGNLYKKNDAQQQKFMEDVMLFVAKPTCIFCCRKLVVEAFGHASKSLNFVCKLQANGSTSLHWWLRPWNDM